MTTNGRMNGIAMGGLAGGMAEVLMVALYAMLAGISGLAVAEGVSAAVFGARFTGGDAVLVGVGVHFALSLAIAACFVPLVPALARRVGRGGVVLSAALALVAVWALNFLVVLPAVAPGFVEMVPLWVSFLSKLAFGAAMGVALVSPGRFSGWRRRTPA